MGHMWIVDAKEKMEFFIQFIRHHYDEGKIITYSIKEESRTSRQNGAMHLWFRNIANALNDSGAWAKHPFNDEFEIPFTEVLVKEMLYKPVIKAMYGKDSTSSLQVKELSEAAEVLVRWLSEHKRIYVPFPQSIKDEMRGGK